jgi:hypothetical protein
LVKAKACDFTDIIDFSDDSIPYRERIMTIEKRLMELPDVEMRLEHSFNGGVYLRTLYAPKNTLMTSYIYRLDHQCIISSGVVSYRDETMGGKIIGPYIFRAFAGSKRCVYVHEDMVWTTAIKTNATTQEEAEKEIYFRHYEEWDNEQLGGNIITVGG